MRFHKKFVILSILCCFLISTSGISAFAADTTGEAQTYYTLNDGIIEAYIYPDVSWEQVKEDNDIDETTLYTQDGSDWLGFLITWNEAEFTSGMASGQEIFTVSGTCIPDFDYWNQHEIERWQAGKIKINDGAMKLQVHVRPESHIAWYENSKEPITRKVRSCTPFEDVVFYDLTRLETNSPYDPEKCGFHIEWSREEYEKGIQSGAQTFTMHGNYTTCEDPEMQKLLEDGWIKPQGTEELIIEVEQRPTSPRVYYDPYASTEEFHTTVSRSTPLEELNLPASCDLELRGEDYDYADVKTFAIQWNKEEYEKGLASGAKHFLISGKYTADRLDQIEKEWWNGGLITIDDGTGVADAIITVAEEAEKLPYSVSLKKDWDESIYPLFTLPNPGKVEAVICMVSSDGKKWYEYDATTYVQNNFAKNEIPAYIYDKQDQLISIPNDAPSYYKIIIKGGPYAGESEVITRNPPHDLTDADDDISGDRGGGGQGEHDRPDKDDNQVPPVMPPEVIPPVEPPPIIPPEIPVTPPEVLPELPTIVPPVKVPGSAMPADSTEVQAANQTQPEATEMDILTAAVDSHNADVDDQRAGGRGILKKTEPAVNGEKRIPAYAGALAGTAALMAAGSLLALRRRR